MGLKIMFLTPIKIIILSLQKKVKLMNRVLNQKKMVSLRYYVAVSQTSVIMKVSSLLLKLETRLTRILSYSKTLNREI